MRRPPPDPPAAVERLFCRLLPPHSADEIAGDLREEFSAVAMRRHPFAARLWYAVQAIRVLAALRVQGARGGRRDVGDSPNPGDSVMRTLAIEIRHAVRSLRTHTTLTAVVVVTLALGLAANASMFQVIDALIVRPFTFEGVDRIALIAETAPGNSIDFQESVSPANFLDIRAQADVFEQLGAYEWWDVNVASDDGAERVSGFYITANFFDVLGTQPALGRSFTTSEEVRGNHRRVILGHAFWSRRFAADPAILGRTALIDGEPYEVVGVMPRGFEFPLGAEIWAPLAMDAKTAARRDSRYLTVVGRLAQGRSLDEGHAQVAAIGQRLAQQYPDVNKGRGARAVSLIVGMRDAGLGPIAALWQASAAFVLLIACANIANLLLARGATREREIAVRTALGASRLRIVRELLIESLLLASAAVPLALALAWAGIELIRANLPPRLVRFVAGWQTMDIDVRVVLFTAALAVVASGLFGLLPALRGSRPALTSSLKEGGRGTTIGLQRHWLRRSLVVGQIALALPLLVASGLSTLSANSFLYGWQGFNPAGVLGLRVAMPEARYTDPAARRLFVEDTLRRFSALPGVTAATASNVLPSMSSNPMRGIEIDGRPNPDPANPPLADYRTVAPSYFATLQQPMLRGRSFNEADTHDAQKVAIVSNAFAEKFFPNEDPIGRRLRFPGDDEWQTVVGVSDDVIHNWFTGRNRPTIFRPYSQASTLYVAFALRTDGEPSALALPAQAAIREVDRAQAAYDVLTMTDAIHERTIGLQYVAGIMGTFGLIALALAVVGVYGVMAFMVTQRTHEIGVRIALGATRRDVLRLTVGNAARLTALGVGLGLLVTLAMGRALEAVLVGVLAADHRVSAVVALVLVAAAVLAGYVPARRATGIDPITALRE